MVPAPRPNDSRQLASFGELQGDDGPGEKLVAGLCDRIIQPQPGEHHALVCCWRDVIAIRGRKVADAASNACSASEADRKRVVENPCSDTNSCLPRQDLRLRACQRSKAAPWNWVFWRARLYLTLSGGGRIGFRAHQTQREIDRAGSGCP